MGCAGYNTRQKQMVTDQLVAFGARAVTAEEVMDCLRARAQAVGKTTVYRQLEKLVENGAARKILSLEGQALYQYVGDARACETHLHCRCVRCGELAHMDACCSYLSAHLMEEHGFALDAGRTVLLGMCRECREGKK